MVGGGCWDVWCVVCFLVLDWKCGYFGVDVGCGNIIVFFVGIICCGFVCVGGWLI